MARRITLQFASCFLVGFSLCSEAQIYETNNVVVQTFAGSAFRGYVDGVGQLTMSTLLDQSSPTPRAIYLCGMVVTIESGKLRRTPRSQPSQAEDLMAPAPQQMFSTLFFLGNSY